jgi:hypothetical protein
MNAYTTEVSYAPGAALALPPILVSGTDQAAIERGARTVEASGMRVADRVLVSVAAERIRYQISLSAVWLELGDMMPQLWTEICVRSVTWLRAVDAD